MNTSSNEIWKDWQNYRCFELREHRFREEMRPLFFQYLGITPDSQVLDAGCGTGVFGRYLAKGLQKGHVTGFDINAGAIEFGRSRLKELALDDQVTLEVADGFDLPYVTDQFDAVTNYTYIGVLSDPLAGFRELIRVCKPEGIVSCVTATQNIQSVQWQGDYPFAGARELQKLAALEQVIFGNFARQADVLRQSAEWTAFRYPKMFEACGLTDIHLYPFAHSICYNDDNLPLTYRKMQLLDETASEIEWVQGRYQDKQAIYNHYGFGDADLARLVELMGIKLDYLQKNFEWDQSYEWQGSMNFVVSGKKRLL
jgi:ubiquinone/menaquinone biosynthesis C-methylase UbiE